MKKIFEVEGMHCKSCKILIEDELTTIQSIKEYKVSLENKSMEINMNDDCTKQVLDAIKGLGYKVRVLS